MKKLISIIFAAVMIFTACHHKITNETMQTEPKKGNTVAILHTNMGDLSMLLYTDVAPKTSENFIKLAKDKKYNGVSFHRVIKDFMIQTGDFESGNGMGGYSHKGPGTTILDEFGEGLEHVKGAVSMANRGPHTGGSQFFIVQAEEGTMFLDGKHAIFGYIYGGLNLVDKIANVETSGADMPVEPIIIETIEIKEV